MSEFTRSFLFGGLGAVVLALTFIDLFATTLTVGGTGPVTKRLPPLIWMVMRGLGRATGSERVMSLAGMLTLLVISTNWVMLLWGGWLLVYSADPWSIVDAQTGLPATPVERTYFVGYTMFTLGLGDYRPHGEVWQMLTVLVVGTGLTAVTLVISYIVPVISAAAQRRALAARLSTLGRTPDGILRRAWDGRGFHGLAANLHDLTAALTQQAQQHQVYPVLSNFHPSDPHQSLTLRLSALDEALLVLLHAVPEEARPHAGTMIGLREAVATLLQTLGGSDPIPDPQPPPPPDLRVLRELGLAPPPPQHWAAVLDDESERRCRLRALVLAEGWSWENVIGGSAGPDHYPAG